MDRRRLLSRAALAGIGAAVRLPAFAEEAPTEFQIACMTYVYRAYPLQRALEGISKSGYRYVAWGTEHVEADGRKAAVMPAEGTAAQAKALGDRCRDHGLQPLMMFSIVYPEHKDGLDTVKRRIEQAHAAGMPQVLTFGHTENGGRKLWEERFQILGPLAKDAGVTLVIKQHGGETGTGEACAKFTRELAHPSVKVCYDSGNVMDYLDVDPIPDLKQCQDEVRSFCVKDHRNFPKDEDCGPGYGEIDHYKLLAPVAFGRGRMPLCCENISQPLLPSRSAEDVDRQAVRAREFLETVIRGLHEKGTAR